MKAEEIRHQELIMHSKGSEGGSILDCAYFLQEIAAQFADLNERLDGFMASMLQLTKAINELNSQLRSTDPPTWWTGKAS